MKTLKHRWTLLAALLTSCFVTACGDGGDSGGTGGEARKQFAFVTNGVASFWTIAESGARRAGDELDVGVDVLMPAGGISDQKKMIEDLATRGVDGIAVSPIDPDNQTSLLNKAAQRTLLITHDSDAPDSDRLCYIGMDNYKAGRLCGQLIKEALPEGGKVMIFIGRLEQDNSKRRRQGVIDELMDRSEDSSRYDAPGQPIVGEKFTVLGTRTDQFDRAKGKANAEDALSRYPKIDGMVGLFAYNPPLILQALEQAGKLGEVKVIAFDEDDQTLTGIQEGTVYGTVVQNPYAYGYESIKLLHALSNDDQSAIPAGGFMDIPARQIRKDTVDAFWADLKAKLGE